jgi:uncharacterized protein (DUF1810 family)
MEMGKENMKNYKTVYEFTNEFYSRPENNMQRFIEAQNKEVGNSTIFQQAMDEMTKGQKVNHWMWFVFPQLRGLGKSYTSNFYGLDNLADANRFLHNDQTNMELGIRIIKCFNILLSLETKDPVSVFGNIDARKLFSCATLFSHTHSDFKKTVCDCAREILQKFFNGQEDGRTLKLMNYVNINELAVRLRALIDPFDDFSGHSFQNAFPNICVPYQYIEPTKENLFATEEYYIKKAIDLCNKNSIGYFKR